MSYNIDSSRYLSGSLSILGSKANRLLKKHGREMPESNLLEDIDVDDPGAEYVIECPWWNGEGSGRSFDLLLTLLAETTGEAEILLVCEGGDKISGIHVKDGVVTEKAVRMVLE